MQYSPHKYQNYSKEFIETHPVSSLFLDCGLGKTVITLTALNDLLFDSFDAHKVLIIAPLRVGRDVWPNEIKKWCHLRNLEYKVVIGTEAERLSALRTRADIYIINRENVQWLIEKSGIKFDFDTLVLDELSSFKNGRSKRFQSLLKVRPYVKRVVGLTGTPAGNGLMDLWAEFRILDKGERLGRFITHYRDQYFAPDKRNGQVIFSYKPLPFAEEAIYDKISDITISMKAVDHLDMPKLIMNDYKVYLDEVERKEYDKLKQELVLNFDEEDEISVANMAVLSGKLLQMASGAVYTDDLKIKKIHDKKLDALEDLIEQANGKPVLVAYWFKHDLERIEERLKELNINYEVLASTKSIEDWNDGKLQVGLIHPASAGYGLNLQDGGNILVWFSLTWSLELYQQTVARLYRQGQKEGTVVIEHIVADKTIDEDVSRALRNKDTTQQALIDAVKANISRR